MQQHWMMARQIGYYVVAVNQGKNGKIKKPQDLFEIDIDREIKKRTPKKERLVAVVRKVGDGKH